MRLPFHVVQMLGRKLGHDLRSPSDCQLLSLDIEGRTRVHVGATTLKRLLGFVPDERTPHQSTLDAIAHYLGFAHWKELAEVECKGNSDFEAPDGEVRSAELQLNAEVAVTYLPDRMVTMCYLGNQRFHVVDSQNSKLLQGDEVEIHNFVLHHPLFVVNVWRDGQALGPFTAGRISGLSSIKVS